MSDISLKLESTYTNLPDIFYTELSPVPVVNPEVVIFNQKLAEDIGLDLTHLNPQQKADLLAGNLIPDGCTPFAQAYAGHQFGNFTMLGDGELLFLVNILYLTESTRISSSKALEEHHTHGVETEEQLLVRCSGSTL